MHSDRSPISYTVPVIFTGRLTLGFGVLEEMLLLESLLDLLARQNTLELDRRRLGVAVVRTCSAMVLSLRIGCELVQANSVGSCRQATVQSVHTHFLL